MPDTIHMLGAVEVQAAAAGDAQRAPRVSILAYSGGIMRPSGWGESKDAASLAAC